MINDVRDSYVFSSRRLVAATDLVRHIVVETADAVLIAPRDRVQHVKQLVAELKGQGRPEGLEHPKAYRPWGSAELLASGDHFQIKRLKINPGARLTLQKHTLRAEHWIVLQGAARILRGTKEYRIGANESIAIPPHTLHKLENPGPHVLEIIEVRSGERIDEKRCYAFGCPVPCRTGNIAETTFVVIVAIGPMQNGKSHARY